MLNDLAKENYNRKLQLNYDKEIVGKTTADAIYYLRNLGHPDYVTSGATIQFLKIVDWMCQFSQVFTQNKRSTPKKQYENFRWEVRKGVCPIYL